MIVLCYIILFVREDGKKKAVLEPDAITRKAGCSNTAMI